MADRHEELSNAGRWLRRQRQRKHLTVRSLANLIGTTTQAVYNWESGKNAVSDESAEKLADLFGVSVIDARWNLGLWVPASLSSADVAPDPELNAEIERARDARERLQRIIDEAQAALDELRAGGED